MNFIKNFMHDDDGVTAIEYGLIAALIAVAIILAVTTVGQRVGFTFDTVAAKLPTAG